MSQVLDLKQVNVIVLFLTMGVLIYVCVGVFKARWNFKDR